MELPIWQFIYVSTLQEPKNVRKNFLGFLYVFFLWILIDSYRYASSTDVALMHLICYNNIDIFCSRAEEKE